MKNKVKRAPKRGLYELSEIYEILDQNYIAHVGFETDEGPFVIPMMYGRDQNTLFLHGATSSRIMKIMENNNKLCLSISSVQGIVLARSAFHHSLNYESCVLFGEGYKVFEEDKIKALKCISDHLLPGRWEETRAPNAKELKATSIIGFRIQEASGKRRTGPPKDEKADYNGSNWAGLIYVKAKCTSIEPDPVLSKDIPVPASVIRFESKHK
jgi:nitroimidazol reductase NimA-like FMN-containing flavoprotein (pyridoxamine 5'-phosphate oxidase superfamily)